MTKLVIFDMDGLMFDTEPLYFKANMKTAEKVGIPFDYTFYKQFIGSSDQDFFDAMYRQFDEEKVTQFIAESGRDLKEALFASAPVLKKGLTDLLTYINEEGYKAVVASSSERAIVRQLLENAGIHKCFNGIVGGDEVKHSKPDPEIFIKAKELAGEDTSDVLVLEDSLNGIKAANAAGFPVVMVPDLIEPDDNVRELTLDVCHDLHEVLRKIKSEKLI